MSSGIDNNGGIVLNRVFRPAKAVEKADGASRPDPVSAGPERNQTAKTNQAAAPDLSKLNVSRRPDVNVNETLGVQDRNARFYLDKRVNKRVVQLREVLP